MRWEGERITHANEKKIYIALRKFYISEIGKYALSHGTDLAGLSEKVGVNLPKIVDEGKFSPLRRAYIKLREMELVSHGRESLSKEPVIDGMNSKPRPGKSGDWIGK